MHRRYSECRTTFVGAASARETQCVCGRVCRGAPDRGLARGPKGGLFVFGSSDRSVSRDVATRLFSPLSARDHVECKTFERFGQVISGE